MFSTIERKQTKIAAWIIKITLTKINLIDLPKNQTGRTEYNITFLELNANRRIEIRIRSGIYRYHRR